jgi:hypothetical protein
MTRENPATLSVAVADPTQTNAFTILVTLNRAASSVASADPAIVVTQLRPTIQFAVAVGGALGRSFTAKFNLTNSPPALAPIADRTINAGVYLTITNAATDPDIPWQTLAFALNGPTNASIVAGNGLCAWRPLVAQAGATHPFAVSVSDNGAPSLSATQTFQVVVRPLNAPTLTGSTFANGQATLHISGDTGPDYFVQASTNLTDWATILATNQPALPLTWTDPNTSAFLRRFYRVRLGP